MTRTIEVPLPEELLRRVDEKAQSAGLKRDAYIRAILSKDVASDPSISAILSSFCTQVASSGIGDEELDRPLRSSRRILQGAESFVGSMSAGVEARDSPIDRAVAQRSGPLQWEWN